MGRYDPENFPPFILGLYELYGMLQTLAEKHAASLVLRSNLGLHNRVQYLGVSNGVDSNTLVKKKKKCGGIISPLLLMISRTITEAGNFVCMMAKTSSGVFREPSIIFAV